MNSWYHLAIAIPIAMCVYVYAISYIPLLLLSEGVGVEVIADGMSETKNDYSQHIAS